MTLSNPHWTNPEDVPEIPAALSITYGISPLDEGFKRIGENPATPNLDTALLDICIDLVRKKIGLDKIQCKVLNLSEALNGIRGFAPMRHDSADGLPASLDKASSLPFRQPAYENLRLSFTLTQTLS